MPPIPPERFASMFRGLARDERAAFVAAIRAERGWETTVDGGTVVAARAGERERIRVVDPGRFGTPSLEDVDTLVVARDREAVRAAAADAGIRYLTPADIREQLLYGLDRPAAVALFERTFDHPLETTGDPEPTLQERVRAAGAAVGTAISTRAGSRPVVVVLLIAVLVGAAIASPALTSERDDATAVVPAGSATPGDVGAVGERTDTPTAATTGAQADDGRPPGIGEERLENHVALANAHAAAITGTARTLRMAASGPPEAPPLDGREAWNATARIEHPRQYRYDYTAQHRGENGSRTVSISIYTDGDTKFRQLREGNDTTYQRYATETTGDASGFATEIREYLVLYLDGDASTVECAATLTDGDCFAYRIVVTGAPPVLPAEAEDYRAVAVVQDDGVVASLDVRYTLTVDGERVPVAFRFEYENLGNTTAPPPDWLDAARNETAG